MNIRYSDPIIEFPEIEDPTLRTEIQAAVVTALREAIEAGYAERDLTPVLVAIHDSAPFPEADPEVAAEVLAEALDLVDVEEIILTMLAEAEDEAVVEIESETVVEDDDDDE